MSPGQLLRRRAHAVWLLDSTDPSGAAVMALRRIQVLRDHVAGRALAMRAGAVRAPVGSRFADVELVTGVAGRLDLAGAELVVTTSGSTLAWAAPRLRPDQRIVHFVHVAERVAFADERFVHNAWRAVRIFVPPAIDPVRFAAILGLEHDRVIVAEDFVPASESLLSPATAPVVLSVGRLRTSTGVHALVEGFALAAPRLSGWQLRLCGWGPIRPELQQFIERHDLHSRVVLMGPRHDIAAEYLAAGVLAQISAEEADGLAVLEALAAGVPVLGPPTVPALARHVRNGVNGLVLPRTDPVAIGEALTEVAEPGLRARLAAGARACRAGAFTRADARDLAAEFRRALVTQPRPSPLSGGSRV